MKSVILSLKNYFNHSSETEKLIIKYLLKNPENVVDLNIYQLSEKTFTSPSTIIRLCKKVGFKGYKEFHSALIYEIAVKKSADEERCKMIKKDDDLKAIIEKITMKNISALDNTKKRIDIDVLQKCVEEIDKARNVCLFGVGASLLVAKDAYLKFLRINKSCYINDDFHAQIVQAKNMDQSDIAIIVSYSGLTEEMIKCANIIKETGAKIIVITGSEDSPISKIADYILLVAYTELLFREGATSSRIAQLNVIDILYTAFINRNYELNIKQFNRTHIKKDNLNKANGHVRNVLENNN